MVECPSRSCAIFGCTPQVTIGSHGSGAGRGTVPAAGPSLWSSCRKSFSEAVSQSRFPVLAAAHQGIVRLAKSDPEQPLCLFPLQAAQLFDREAGKGPASNPACSGWADRSFRVRDLARVDALIAAARRIVRQLPPQQLAAAGGFMAHYDTGPGTLTCSWWPSRWSGPGYYGRWWCRCCSW
jgi:hypothetical protein